MAKRTDVKSSRTYATEAALERAVAKLNVPDSIRYHVAYDVEGRCYPIFIGTECLQYGIHFQFPVVG